MITYHHGDARKLSITFFMGGPLGIRTIPINRTYDYNRPVVTSATEVLQSTYTTDSIHLYYIYGYYGSLLKGEGHCTYQETYNFSQTLI